VCSLSGVRISPGSRPSAGLSLPRSRPIRPGGMGPCESSLRLEASVDSTRECNLAGGGIRDEEPSPGGVPRDARDPEPEEDVDDNDTFDDVAPVVKGVLEESKRDLAVVGDIGGNGYSYGPEESVLYGVPTNCGSSSSSLLPLELSFGRISMGAGVAKDRGGGGGARVDANSGGGGRFICIGRLIRPKLDMG
jgi:hypothetical protein